jgi:hypothetical protein
MLSVYAYFDAVLVSLLTSLTPLQLTTTIFLILGISFSFASGMCNVDDDDDCSECPPYNDDSSGEDSSEEDENIPKPLSCKTCGEEYFPRMTENPRRRVPEGYCSRKCVSTKIDPTDDEYMCEFKKELKYSRSRKRRSENVCGYVDEWERVCWGCNDLIYAPNGPHWHTPAEIADAKARLE